MQRLMFVGSYKVIESVVTQRFDRFVPGVDHTHIFYGGPKHHLPALADLYRRFDIDVSKMSFYHDSEVPGSSDRIRRFGPWIYQQLLKFLVLDMMAHDQLLIQDCDTFMLEPYQAFESDRSQPLVVRNYSFSHDDYYRYVKTLLGIDRQVPDCFVTEFVPVSKQDWNAMKEHMQELHGRPWMESICDLLTKDQPTNTMYLAEPEILGNWAVSRGSSTVAQRRFSITSGLARSMKQGDFSGIDLEGSNAVCFINADANSKFTVLDIEPIIESIESNKAITNR